MKIRMVVLICALVTFAGAVDAKAAQPKASAEGTVLLYNTPTQPRQTRRLIGKLRHQRDTLYRRVYGLEARVVALAEEVENRRRWQQVEREAREGVEEIVKRLVAKFITAPSD